MPASHLNLVPEQWVKQTLRRCFTNKAAVACSRQPPLRQFLSLTMPLASAGGHASSIVPSGALTAGCGGGAGQGSQAGTYAPPVALLQVRTLRIDMGQVREALLYV